MILNFILLAIYSWIPSPVFSAEIALGLGDSIPQSLPGTAPLLWDLTPDEISFEMMKGAHHLIDRKIDQSINERGKYWNRDFNSPEAYERSIEANRQRFKKYIGIRDQSDNLSYSALPAPAVKIDMEIISKSGESAKVAETDQYQIFQVRWPVLDGVHGEGLLVQPKSEAMGHVIAIPDADQTPEQLMGMAPGIQPASQFARHLAENGYQVLIPVLIDRTIIDLGGRGRQTHREWIYRQAFHMGRHVIGFEVQKMMAAIDWMKKTSRKLSVGVAGYGEGGLLAMYTAAIDPRIDATMISGYFQNRQQVWNEPIYRNVWGLLTEFGDAEIISMIAPRSVIIEYSEAPATTGKHTVSFDPLATAEYTGYKGQVSTPDYKEVQSEFERSDAMLPGGFQSRELVVGKNNRPVPFGSNVALAKFTRHLGNDSPLTYSDEIPEDLRTSFDPVTRQLRQVNELQDHIQRLMHHSPQQRNEFFLYKVMPEFENPKWNTESYVPYLSPEHFIEKTKEYREYYAEEILGTFHDELSPPGARTRKIYDNERWEGYEVVLDVYDEFITPGVLLLPKNIKPGEQKPVVVVQHGRNGVPDITIRGKTSYYDIGAKLATQGFIVYAPYGLFKGEDQYRFLDRKANALKKTLFSFLLAQHKQILNWLNTLPYVDVDRIAFYGKSYGGETAMRVPSVLEGYALSICSADFGNWTRKVVDVGFYNSFMNTTEWEMPYFNMGSTFSYAEMAYLIFPRPFMVERGHHDLVQPDEWVFSEYGKVKFLYDQFNMEDKVTMEVFNGGHASRNVGTFRFLRKHLNWP